MPAANEKPIVRPSVVRMSTPLMYHISRPGALWSGLDGAGEERLHALADGGDELVAIVERQPRRFDRFAEADLDVDRINQQAAFPQGLPGSCDRHRYDWD